MPPPTEWAAKVLSSLLGEKPGPPGVTKKAAILSPTLKLGFVSVFKVPVTFIYFQLTERNKKGPCPALE